MRDNRISTTARLWQSECLPVLRNAFAVKRDALVSATPGAGKTWLALNFAGELKQAGEIGHIHVVSPTVLITRSWRETAAKLGIHLVTDSNAALSADTDIATTYAQIGQSPDTHAGIAASGRTLAINDEIHHAGDDKAWGNGLETALAPARFRLHLSGTPFRHDGQKIPFIAYSDDGFSIADYTYGYARAVEESVCRPVNFNPYDLSIRFRQAPTEDEAARVLRLSLMPKSGLVARMVQDADAGLTERRKRWPDAAGLLVAMTQSHARDCARIIKEVTGESPVVVISESPNAADDLSRFRSSSQRWVVAVKMLSEGVDVPRLMVAVYATNIVTALFFRQFVGRVVRVRKPEDNETAAVYMPRDDRLVREASDIESEIKTALRTSQGRFADMQKRLEAGTSLLTPAETFRPMAAPIEHNFKYTERYRPSYL